MEQGKSQDKSSREKNQSDLVCVTIQLVSGPTSAARKQAWREFWAKLVTEDNHSTKKDSTSSDTSK